MRNPNAFQTSLCSNFSQKHLQTQMQSIFVSISQLTSEKAANRVMEMTPIAVIVLIMSLRKFPDITKPFRPDQEIKHSPVHYVETTGRPAVAKAPDHLRIAKDEFQNMTD
ncbi:hypothetical protein TNCT_689821 [Trichonephila clavata]|uniref:Uncharacterized protein n=1 Tax=Trichonephila clavata TaxID=2740835 RepID=A0A8X6J281_TRICU|nr:hypothetical protein TNCT_689821 [Trichonephila clavata]